MEINFVNSKYYLPGQSGNVNHCWCLYSGFEYKMTEVPLGAYPYLWVSADMLNVMVF